MLETAWFWLPWCVGAVVCLLSSVAATVYAVAYLLDLITDRLVRQYNLFDAVLATGIARIRERRKRKEADRASQ